jgi:hypothetical protein
MPTLLMICPTSVTKAKWRVIRTDLPPDSSDLS